MWWIYPLMFMGWIENENKKQRNETRPYANDLMPMHGSHNADILIINKIGMLSSHLHLFYF